MPAHNLVLATGVFDQLHSEHINFLKKAKALGKKLIVGLESDRRVRQLKGKNRPSQPAAVRVRNLSKLGLADEILILPENFDQPSQHLRFLQKVQPDILAVSSHTPFLDQKRKLMKQIGGEVVVVHQQNPQVSTSKILHEQEEDLKG